MVGVVGVGCGFLLRKRKRFVVSCLFRLSSSPQPIAMVEKTTRELRKELGGKNEMKKKKTALVLHAGGVFLACQSWGPRKCVLLFTSRIRPFGCTCGGGRHWWDRWSIAWKKVGCGKAMGQFWVDVLEGPLGRVCATAVA